MKNSTNNSGLSQIVAGFNKSAGATRSLVDGTSASKAFDYVFLQGKQEEFESSKKKLIEINQKFFEKLLEASKEDQEQYQEKKTNYLSNLPSNLTSEESKIAGDVYDELYQAQLKKMLGEECEEYEKKAKKFGATVEQNLENANKEADPAYPDVIGYAVLMMTPFGLFAVFDYFDQLQQVYEVLQPAIDGLQTSLENVPFVGDLMKEFYGLSGSEVGSSATAFAGSLSNDFLLKSAISYFATGRMGGKLIDSYDDKKQNFDSAIKKVEKFNSALTNEFEKNKSGIGDRALKNCGLNDEKDFKAIKDAVESKQREIELRKKDVSSFNESFFSDPNKQQEKIQSLLRFDPATANDEQKKAFIEKAWIVFFAEKDSDIASSRDKEKSAPKAIEENSDDNYFNQLSNSQELEFANKFSQIGISYFEKDEELKNSIKDLRLIQGKAMLVGGLQNDSAEFLAHLLPNQKIETLDSKDFESKTLEDGTIYNTQLEKLDPKDLNKMSALILHQKTKTGGHYTALIKQKIVENDGKEKLVWLHYNDDKVVEIKNDEMKSILKDKTVRNVVNVNDSQLPIATKDSKIEIKPAFGGLRNTGNKCFANSAVALINSLPVSSSISKEFSNNLNKVKAPLSTILTLQNNFIANKSAKDVAKEIYKTNQEQQSQILTGKQLTEQKTEQKTR